MEGAAHSLVEVKAIAKALECATTAPEIIEIEAKLAAIESYMRDAGLYDTSEIRPVNETRMRARWKLGQALANVEREAGPGRGKKISSGLKSFMTFLKSLGTTPQTAMAAQRIGTLPEIDLAKALASAREQDVLTTYSSLIKIARPYWYQASREKKHKDIAAAAASADAPMGPFPLILADPPWKFEIYSEKGLERTPDQHYPTLTDKEIINFKVGGIPVAEIAGKDAALLLWCTSSNIVRALDVMDEWGFTYKTQAIWDKGKTGLGLVFRNQHEVLLYGTRGKMPGPQYQPTSLFRYLRGRHSAKPPEIRAEIEKMYPDFDAKTRLELFARETVKGWTSYGFESLSNAAE